MRALSLAFVALSLSTLAQANHREFYTGQTNYITYCLESDRDFWGTKTQIVRPDCDSYNRCDSINTDPGQAPSVCGTALPSYFESGSDSAVGSNAGGDVVLDIVSNEKGGRVECSTYSLAPLVCRGPVQYGFDAFYDETKTVPNPDGSSHQETKTYKTTMHGARIGEAVPQAWRTYDNYFLTGVKRELRVVLEVEPFTFPKNYQFTAGASWDGDSSSSAANISFRSEFFTHQATLVSQTATTQVFKVSSKVNPQAAPAAAVTTYAPEKNQVVIEDSRLKDVLSLGANTKTSYEVVIEVERKSGTNQKYQPVYLGPFVNTDNKSVLTVDLANPELIKLFEEGKVYEINVRLNTTRTGNIYYREDAASSSAFFRLKYSAKGSTEKKH